MAAKIGALAVDLTANSAQFTLAMRQSEDRLKSFQARTNRTAAVMERSFNKMSVAAAAFAKRMVSIPTLAALATGGVGLLGKRAVESADKLGKTAAKIGLTVEALQELRYAAARYGVDQRTTDMALQRLSRRVGEVAQGTGELKTITDQYGIAVRDASGKARPLEDIMGDLAEKVKSAESNQEQLRIAFKAFDSEGAVMVNLLRQGRAGMEKMRQTARNLGIVLDGSMVREAERANDQLTNMEQILSVNLNKALLSLAPTIIRLGAAAANAAPKLERFINSLLPDDLASVNELQKRLKEAEDNLKSLESSGSYAYDYQKKNAREKVEALKKELAARKEEEALIRKTLEGGAPGEFTGPTSASKDFYGLRDTEREFKAFREGILKEREQAKAIRESTSELILKSAQLEAMIAATRDGAESVRVLTDALDLENEATALGVSFTTEQGRAWKQAMEQAQAYQHQLDKTRAAQEEIAQTGQQVGREVSGAFKDILFSANSAADAVRNLGQRLAEMLFDKTAGAAIEALIGTGFSALFSGGIGAAVGGGGAITTPVATIHSGGLAGNPPMRRNVNPALFAGAARYHGGGIAGNEVPAILQAGEEVITRNDQRHRMNGGASGGDVYHIDARGATPGVEQQIAAVLERMRPGIVADSVRATANARRRDPYAFA